MKENSWTSESKKYKEDIKSKIKNSESDQILKFANLISDPEFSLHGKGNPDPLIHKVPKGVNCRLGKRLHEEKLTEKDMNQPIQILGYHSSPVEFDHFDFSKIDTTTGDGGALGPGFYFGETSEFAKIWNEEGYLYICLLTFKHPYVCRNDKDREDLYKLIKAKLNDEGNNTQDMTDFFEQGYDSIISLNEKWDNPEDKKDIKYHNQYVAFEDDQIKILKVKKY